MGAFGFMIGPLFYASNAMVFGSVASATLWEPFRRAISVLSESYFGKLYLKKEPKKWLDMVKLSPPPEKDVRFVQAESCSKNRGVKNDNGTDQPSPHNIYVVDHLMADIR